MASSLSSAGMKTTKAIAAHFSASLSRLAAKCGDDVNSFVCVSVSEVCACTSLTHTHKIKVKSPKAQGALPQTDTRRV